MSMTISTGHKRELRHREVNLPNSGPSSPVPEPGFHLICSIASYALIGLDFPISQLFMYVGPTTHPNHIMCEFRVLSSASLKNKISQDMNLKKSQLIQSRDFKGKAHPDCRIKAKGSHLPRRVKRASALSALVYFSLHLSKFYTQCGA